MVKTVRNPFILSIGIDGASWKAIKKYESKGILRELPRLAREGCRGILKSYPPITYPQWYVLLSGLNPGNIGVYGFVKYDRYSNTLNIVKHEDFKGSTLFDIFSKYGTRFAVINTPSIIPRKTNYSGYIIGDPLLPRPKVYPKELLGILSAIQYKNYDIKISKSFINTVSAEDIVKLAKKLISQRIRLAEYLIKKDNKLNFMHITLFVIDNVQHFFGLDSDITMKLWSYIDNCIGRLIKLLETKYTDQYIINIISDHGFDNIDTIYNIGCDLEKRGYIKLKQGIFRRILTKLNINRERIGHSINRNQVLSKIVEFLLKSNKVREFAQKLIPATSGDDPLGHIDITRSIVIFANLGLYLTSRYTTESQKSKLINELKEYLMDVNSSGATSKPLFELITEGKELFYGRYSSYSPDLLLVPSPGVHILSKISEKQVFLKPPYGDGWIADHTTNAVFISFGPSLKSNYNEVKGNTCDYAPTILELLGLNDSLKRNQNVEFDGKPLMEVINRYSL